MAEQLRKLKYQFYSPYGSYFGQVADIAGLTASALTQQSDQEGLFCVHIFAHLNLIFQMKSPKKALIITYYWPPGGGAGVQRWLKFAKYLPQFGWEPVIYTPENSESPAEDYGLLSDIKPGMKVVRKPIWEPYDLYKFAIGQKKSAKINAGFLTEKQKPGMAEKISVWIRGNLFIPDARKFWIKPSVKFLKKYLNDNPVDVIVSTGPPHSMHLIALKLKERIGIPWLADFRDPWTNIDYYNQLMLTKAADAKHRKLESEVLEKADAVISVGKTMNEEFKNMAADKTKFFVVTNGFDEDDLPSGKIHPDEKFSLLHLGSMNKARNPEVLWKVLGKKIQEDDSFKKDLSIRMIGKTDITVRSSVLQSGLADFTEYIDYIPHIEAMKKLMQAQVLLLPLNNAPNAKGILTGKMFEYLAARRPVLCIGPENGDAAEIIMQSGAGLCVHFNNEAGMGNAIHELYSSWRSKNFKLRFEGIENYSRRKLTADLAIILDKIHKQISATQHSQPENYGAKTPE